MAIESSNTELRRILDAIRSSDVVESRIPLLEKLGEINISETSDLGSLIDCLTAFWEDYTCLDVTQCMFNKAILSVGSKHLNSDMSSCASQFLSLGTKASEWCGKHLKMTLMSSEESQEEDHANLFFQLLLDLLSFSAAICSALARSPILVDKASMDVTEKFILEQLILTKDSISESKRIQSHGSDVIKAGHVVIDSIIRLCGAYSQSMNWNEYHEKVEEKSTMDCTEANNMNHLITITQSAIEKLHEIGLIAANNGGNLVSILNVSWKGVVTLLQLGGGVFGTKVNVANIILTLISLVNETLKTTAEAWSSSVKETVSVTEARRKFLPVKFYLINAVKVSCLYPCQAFTVHTELTLCILVISTFKLSMSNRKHLKTASEVYTELLERTSFDLLNSLLCSDKVSQNSKLEVLDCVFITETVSSRDPNDQVTISIMDAICSVASQGFDGVLSILHGRVALFLTLLRYSDDLEEDIKVWTSRKLGWILDSLVDETVYSAFLVLQIPVLCSSGKNVELVWEPLFSLLLDALKAFAINVSSSVVWTEVESFLLENLFHPHFLCSEIVIELMCFIVRYAEPGMLSRIVEKLCLLMKSVASSDSVIVQNSGMRRLARTISLLLCYETESMVDQVFKSVIDDDRTQLSSVVCLGLLMEGFPIHSLSAKMRNIATQRILTDYFVFIDGFKEKSVKTSTAVDSGFPVFALSASLQSLKISLSDIDVKTLTFLLSVINSYKVTDDKATKKQYSTFLSETLGIISNMKHLYTFDEMEQVVFELENLFVSGPKASNKELYNCKPNLALFISGLAHMKITVSGTKSKFSAACELYHMMLRERHWALIHLAITAFGYFSARTSCDELWRFVPHDAALSFDLLSGTDPNEERFMSAFKVFLDKEATLDLNASSSNQIQLLAKEGHFLKEMFRKVSGMKFESIVCQATAMEIDIELNNERQQKKRKLPDSLNEGMQLIQTGLKVIVNGLSQWKQSQPESSELQTKFMTHCSRLEDEIARLVGLAGNN